MLPAGRAPKRRGRPSCARSPVPGPAPRARRPASGRHRSRRTCASRASLRVSAQPPQLVADRARVAGSEEGSIRLECRTQSSGRDTHLVHRAGIVGAESRVLLRGAPRPASSGRRAPPLPRSRAGAAAGGPRERGAGAPSCPLAPTPCRILPRRSPCVEWSVRGRRAQRPASALRSASPSPAPSASTTTRRLTCSCGTCAPASAARSAARSRSLATSSRANATGTDPGRSYASRL